MDELIRKVSDFHRHGYATPAFSICPPPYRCFQHGEDTFYSTHVPDIRFEGFDFPVARLEDAKAQEVTLRLMYGR